MEQINLEIKNGMVIENNPVAVPTEQYISRLATDANQLVREINERIANLQKINQAISFVQEQTAPKND